MPSGKCQFKVHAACMIGTVRDDRDLLAYDRELLLRKEATLGARSAQPRPPPRVNWAPCFACSATEKGLTVEQVAERLLFPEQGEPNGSDHRVRDLCDLYEVPGRARPDDTLAREGKAPARWIHATELASPPRRRPPPHPSQHRAFAVLRAALHRMLVRRSSQLAVCTASASDPPTSTGQDIATPIHRSSCALRQQCKLPLTASWPPRTDPHP